MSSDPNYTSLMISSIMWLLLPLADLRMHFISAPSLLSHTRMAFHPLPCPTRTPSGTSNWPVSPGALPPSPDPLEAPVQGWLLRHPELCPRPRSRAQCSHASACPTHPLAGSAISASRSVPETPAPSRQPPPQPSHHPQPLQHCKDPTLLQPPSPLSSQEGCYGKPRASQLLPMSVAP